MSRPGDWDLVGLSGDPTPGDSGGVRSIASVYGNTASAAGQTRQLIASVRSASGTGVWFGEAGDAFRELIEDFPSDVQACETSYATARDAMNWWAGRLEDHQASADRGLEHARAADADLQAARSALNTALANAQTTSSALTDIEADAVRYRTVEPPAGKSTPSAGDVAAARRASAAASSAKAAASGRVSDAQARLDAAARMVADAAAGYEADANNTITKLETAYDQALPENGFWEKIRRSGAWQVVVKVATVITIVAAVAAFILSGPIAAILAVVATIAGVIIAINDVMEWDAGLKSGWEAAFSVIMTVIPGGLLLKGGKLAVGGVVKLGLKLAPKATAAVTAALRASGGAAAAVVTRGIRATESLAEGAKSHLAEAATDTLSALQRSKVQMYDRLIAKHPNMARVFDGSRFNWERAGHYQFNEVHVTNPTGGALRRVDSYTPGAAVVERKATQLAEISPKTAKSYIDQAVKQYSPRTEGITIANTDANRAKLGDRFDALVGKQLDGRLRLEVPVQNSPIPQEILDYAGDFRVEIVQVPRVR